MNKKAGDNVGFFMIVGLLLLQTLMVWFGWNVLVVFGIGAIFSVTIPTISLIQAFFFGVILSVIKTLFFGK